MESIQTNGSLHPVDPTAVFGRRIAAFIIDVVIPILIGSTFFARLTSVEYVGTDARAREICDLAAEQGKSEFCSASDQSVILIEPGAQMIVLGLFLYFVLALLIIPSITGGSLGKLLLGLRVVHQSSFEKAGFGGHLLRWILLIVDTFPWFLPLTGLILGLASRGHRRVGDFAANTLVVNKSYVGTPTLVPGVNDDAVSIKPLPGLWEPPIQPPPAEPPHTEPIAHAPITEQPAYGSDPVPETSGDVDVEARYDREPEPTPEPEVASQSQASQPGVEAPMWMRHATPISSGIPSLRPGWSGVSLRASGSRLASSCLGSRASGLIEYRDGAQSSLQVMLQQRGGQCLDLGGGSGCILAEDAAEPPVEDLPHEINGLL